MEAAACRQPPRRTTGEDYYYYCYCCPCWRTFHASAGPSRAQALRSCTLQAGGRRAAAQFHSQNEPEFNLAALAARLRRSLGPTKVIRIMIFSASSRAASAGLYRRAGRLYMGRAARPTGDSRAEINDISAQSGAGKYCFAAAAMLLWLE